MPRSNQWKNWEDLFDSVANAAFEQHEYQEGLDDLLAFVATYGPHYKPCPDDTKLSRCITVIAYNLHQQYPDADVRDLFARFCEALIAYGEMMGEGEKKHLKYKVMCAGHDFIVNIVENGYFHINLYNVKDPRLLTRFRRMASTGISL